MRWRSRVFLSGTVNRENCRYWAPENLHLAMEGHKRYPQTVNVWAKIVRNTIVGTSVTDGSLNGDKYLNLQQHNTRSCGSVPKISKPSATQYFSISNMERHRITHDTYVDITIDHMICGHLLEIIRTEICLFNA